MKRRAAALGYGIAIASAALYIPAALADPWTEPTAVVLFGVAIASFAFVGAVLVARVPGNVIGPLFLAAGATMSVGAACGTFATTNGPVDGATTGVVIAGLINQILFFVPIVIILIGVPLVFPDGRLLTPRWRWIVVVTVVSMLATGAYSLGAAETLDIASVPNPMYAPTLVPLLESLNLLASLLSIVGFGGAAVSVALRYRRGTSIERQQIRWLAATAAVAAVAFPTSILLSGTPLGDSFFLIGFLALLALPFAIAVAVLRYRLYEIDRIVSRTIGWGVVTGVVIGIFFVVLVGLQTILADITKGDTIPVAVSTLLAFALIDPVRSRVQSRVDRRFNRARSDAERTVAAFAGRLRAEFDLPTLATDLRATTDEAVEPMASAVWLRGSIGVRR